MSHFTDVKVWGDLIRREFEDHVQWVPSWVFNNREISHWRYNVQRVPFVPGYHLVHYPGDDADDDDSVVISTHKTLAEAVSILKLLLANGGVVYIDE